MSVLNSVRELCESVLIINRRVVLNRLGILGIFCPKKGRGFRPSAAYLYPNIGRVPPSLPPPHGLPRRSNLSPASLRNSAGTTRSACRDSLQPDWQVKNTSFNSLQPDASFNSSIIARTHIRVHRGAQNKDFGASSETPGLDQAPAGWHYPTA